MCGPSKDIISSYAYNALDNLLTVTQGAQTRTFTYDSFPRLHTAQNPEAGIGSTQCLTTYGYDPNGNMTSKIAPLPNQNNYCTDGTHNVTTTYTYEALNRLTSKSYSDGTTPRADFFYDLAPGAGNWPAWSGVTFSNSTGRLVLACTGSAAGKCTSPQSAVASSYDKLGRTQAHWQCTTTADCNATIWKTSYNYDLAGDVTSWNHPAGFTLTTHVNSARQVMQVSSSIIDSTHPGTLATGPVTGSANSIQYTAWGAVSQLWDGCVGTGCTMRQETYTFNNRLQPWMIELGNSSGSPSSNSCLVYNYFSTWTPPTVCPLPAQAPTSGTGNNGNSMGYWYLDNTSSGFNTTVTNGYDNVNRLTSAVATGNDTYNLTFSYTQDGSNGQYGNMACTTNASPCPVPPFTFSAANNHVNNSGFTYDAAGNVTADGLHTYQWDAEGRLTLIDSGGANPIHISFNALGRRASRNWPSGDVTGYWYNPAGEYLGGYWASGSVWNAEVPFAGRMLAEYTSNTTGPVYFDHPNALGSAGAWTGGAGNSNGEVQFYPWGYKWGDTTNGSVFQVYASLLWYDPETDGYHTPARYYIPRHSRWLTPDPIGVKAVKLDDPQTWNMYAYARNNPTTLTDPSGLTVECSTEMNKASAVACHGIINAANLKDKKGNYKYQRLHDIYTRLNDDERVFTVENKHLSPGVLGNTILEGTNSTGTDFKSASIQMDFDQIKALSAAQPSSKVPGFDMFGGITGNSTLKMLENFGHEGAHGVWALDNPTLGATLQNLINVREPMHYNNPQLVPLGLVIAPLLNLTETYAQQQEQIVNSELNGNP